MSDYTYEMFCRDHDQLNPVINGRNSLSPPEENTDKDIPEKVITKIAIYFFEKYGRFKGEDYTIRFFSVLRFIDHYQKELIELGYITSANTFSTTVQDDLLLLLLDSFKAPQKGHKQPSSPLINQNHDFNYLKVIKALKSAKTD
jgi:hypothetical protein